MNSAHLKRIFDLVRTTTEHVIVSDAQTDDVFVVMHLDEYEQLVASNECQDIDVEDEDSAINVPEEIKEKKIVGIAESPYSGTTPKLQKNLSEDSLVSEQLYFNEQSWKADWESAFLAEHPEAAEIDEDEREEEKFYIEPLE